MISTLFTLLSLMAGTAQMSENVLTDASYYYEVYGGNVRNDRSQSILKNIWTAPQYNVHDYCVLEGSEFYDIVFNLKEKKDIYATEISIIHIPSWGIYFPKRYEVYASTNGEDYTKVYEEDIKEPEPGGHKVTLRAETQFEANYLKFRLYRRKALISMDEIRAFAYSEDGHILPGKSTDETTEMYGNSSISHFIKMPYSATLKNTPAEEAMSIMSDGRTDEYATFHMGGGRHIVWDLQGQKTIEGFKANFLSYPGEGTYIPPVLCVSVSEDANTWYTVQAEATGKYLSENPYCDEYNAYKSFSDREEWQYETSFAPVKTRYVRLSFETNRIYVRAHQVKISEAGPVFSAKKVKGATVKADANIPYGHYPTFEQTGCKRMFYAGMGKTTDSNGKNQLTYDQAKRMFPTFDAVCFTTFFGNISAKEYRDLIFAKGLNCNAIEEVLEDYQTINGENKSVGIWFATCDPENAKKDFDDFLKEFNARGYKHLHILGLYWINEGACYDTQEEIKDLNAYMHSKGYRSFWCPYFGQASMWHWPDWGFDFACLQPNCMFHGHASEDLNMTCEIAKIFGMSVELEIDAPTIDSACEQYRDYLKVIEQKGANKTVQISYLGGCPNSLLIAEDSGYPFAKTLYQETIEYLNRQ